MSQKTNSSHVAERNTADNSVCMHLLIDKLATDFEQRWGLETEHLIEIVLQESEQLQLGKTHREQLFKELLSIEIELRGQHGLTVDSTNLRDRFPEFENIILEVISGSAIGERTERAARIYAEGEEDRVSHRYTLQTEIARGGMGVVYRGFDLTLRRYVAIKLLHEKFLGDEEAIKRFEREPVICGGLQHPNIVPVYDAGVTDDGVPYFAMKLIGGHTLAELLEKSEIEFGSEAAIEIFHQICNAIASAHRQGIIHRDLKPSNIMVADLGEIYVMDWGLSGKSADVEVSNDESSNTDTEHGKVHAESPTEPKDNDLTSKGTIFGTPRYMPPELLEGTGGRSSKRVDVYCLGAMLCELLIGKTPSELGIVIPSEHLGRRGCSATSICRCRSRVNRISDGLHPTLCNR